MSTAPIVRPIDVERGTVDRRTVLRFAGTAAATAVAGAAAGSGPTDEGGGTADSGDLPGFGLRAALAGLTGAAALRRWRRDDEA